MNDGTEVGVVPPGVVLVPEGPLVDPLVPPVPPVVPGEVGVDILLSFCVYNAMRQRGLVLPFCTALAPLELITCKDTSE